MFYFLQENSSSAIELIDGTSINMVEFFNDAISWGISAGLKTLSFMAAISLVVYLFKK